MTGDICKGMVIKVVTLTLGCIPISTVKCVDYGGSFHITLLLHDHEHESVTNIRTVFVHSQVLSMQGFAR